jgi:hypothetical protein
MPLLHLFGVGVSAVIRTLNFLDDRLHLLDLTAPFFLAHLEVLLEQLVIGLAIAATKAVPEGSVLTVVVVEVQMVPEESSQQVNRRGQLQRLTRYGTQRR